MEIKKTSKASLENKKSNWLLVGYVIVLVFMFVAFEWSKRDVRIDMSGAITENVFEQEIEIPITEQPELAAPCALTRSNFSIALTCNSTRISYSADASRKRTVSNYSCGVITAYSSSAIIFRYFRILNISTNMKIGYSHFPVH